MTHSEAQSAVGLVEYQAGSVVSREIIRKPTGTVTAFALEVGQGVSEHTTPFDALVHVLDGAAKITIGGKSVTVKQGELVIMPANVPHALEAMQRFKMMLTMIRGQ